MRFLLDTCAFLWLLGRTKALSPRARAAIAEPGNDLFLSAASAWEIAIKVKLGKLTLPDDASVLVPKHMKRSAITPLWVSHAHALRAGSLELHHHDPFDRLLAAQAELEQLTLLTPDRWFAPYGVDTLW